MTPTEAIREIHQALARCSAAGYITTGRLYLVKARNAGENVITARPHNIDGVECATIEASVKTKFMEMITPMIPMPARAPTGNVCPTCGSANLKRSGTCETCQECGSTTGCG